MTRVLLIVAVTCLVFSAPGVGQAKDKAQAAAGRSQQSSATTPRRAMTLKSSFRGTSGPRCQVRTEITARDSTDWDGRAYPGATRDGYGRAILQAGLYAQLRSSPTMHHSTPQLAPIIPVSSAME
jgi:hypothetical protein